MRLREGSKGQCPFHLSNLAGCKREATMEMGTRAHDSNPSPQDETEDCPVQRKSQIQTKHLPKTVVLTPTTLLFGGPAGESGRGHSLLHSEFEATLESAEVFKKQKRGCSRAGSAIRTGLLLQRTQSLILRAHIRPLTTSCAAGLC